MTFDTNVKLIIIFIALDTVDSFHKHNFQKLDDITLKTNLYLLLCYLILSLMYKITDWDVLYHHHFYFYKVGLANYLSEPQSPQLKNGDNHSLFVELIVKTNDI